MNNILHVQTKQVNFYCELCRHLLPVTELRQHNDAPNFPDEIIEGEVYWVCDDTASCMDRQRLSNWRMQHGS